MEITIIKRTCTTCGHEFEVANPFEDAQKAQQYEEWIKKNISECRDCFSYRKRVIESRKNVDYFVPLSGPKEQLEQAESIRENFYLASIKYIREERRYGHCTMYGADTLNWLLSMHTDARYWIAHEKSSQKAYGIKEMLQAADSLLRTSQSTTEARDAAVQEEKSKDMLKRCDLLASCFMEVMNAREIERCVKKSLLSDGEYHTCFELSYDSSPEYGHGTIKYYWGIGGYIWIICPPYTCEYSTDDLIPSELIVRAYTLYQQKNECPSAHLSIPSYMLSSNH